VTGQHEAASMPAALRRALGAWLLVAALVVAVVVVGLATLDRTRDDEPAGLADVPVEVAQDAARTFFTLDHRTLDEDIDRVLAMASGDFLEQYESQSADLRETVAEKRLVITATLPETGTAVEHVGDGEVWVLVPVDVRTEQDGGEPDDVRYRTRVVLTRGDDGWLVSRLEQVG